MLIGNRSLLVTVWTFGSVPGSRLPGALRTKRSSGQMAFRPKLTHAPLPNPTPLGRREFKLSVERRLTAWVTNWIPSVVGSSIGAGAGASGGWSAL